MEAVRPKQGIGSSTLCPKKAIRVYHLKAKPFSQLKDTVESMCWTLDYLALVTPVPVQLSTLSTSCPSFYCHEYPCL